MPTKEEDAKATATTAEAPAPSDDIVRTYQNADGTVAVDATQAEFAETYEEQGYRLVVDPNTDPAEAQAAAEEAAAAYAESNQSGEPASEVSQASPTATKAAEKSTPTS